MKSRDVLLALLVGFEFLVAQGRLLLVLLVELFQHYLFLPDRRLAAEYFRALNNRNRALVMHRRLLQRALFFGELPESALRVIHL